MRIPAIVAAGLVALAPMAVAGPAEPIPLPPQTAAARLAAYLKVDTSVSEPDAVARAAELLAGMLRQAGLAPARYVGPRGHTSLACRLAADAPRRGGTIVLLHHLDVVPAGEGWSTPPFGGIVRDDAIWGRGAVDAKGLGIAHLEAFLDAARSGLPRTRDLLLLATADEESGGAEGVGWLLAAHPELFAGVEAVLNEGGLNRTGRERPLWFGIETAQKRPLWIELVARGRGGHASALAPASPTHELVRALARIVDRPARWRLEEPAGAALAAQARLDPGLAATLARLPETLAAGAPERTLPPGVLGYLDDTLQVTTLEAAPSVNVIARQARARLDGRLLPATNDRAMLAELAELAGPEVELRVLLAAPPAAPSPTDTPAFRALAAAVADEAPAVPAFISGATDSRYFRERGIAAYGFSPFALDGAVLAGIHGPDERMPIAELSRGIERMKRVVRALVLADGPDRSDGARTDPGAVPPR